MLFIIVFYHVKLYSDLVLHVIYVGLQAYGWYHWLHGNRGRPGLPVTELRIPESVLWLCSALLASVGWGFLMATFTDAAAPYPDAFIAATSLVAQWLIARKKLQAWLFWIAVDIVAIGVYLYKSLYFATALYCLFFLLAIAGFVKWKQSLPNRGGPGEGDDSWIDSRKIRSAALRAPATD